MQINLIRCIFIFVLSAIITWENCVKHENLLKENKKWISEEGNDAFYVKRKY